MSEQCKEYPLHLQEQEGARYYTGVSITVGEQWVSDTLVKGDERFTADIIKQKLKERGYEVIYVEEYQGYKVGWHAELTFYPHKQA